MCVCLFCVVICVPPLVRLFKVNISWVSLLFLDVSYLAVTWPVVRPACSISRCARHSSQTSRSQCVCVCVCTYKCVCVHILCIYRCLYACACALLPPPLLSFICFPFQPLHEVMNAWVWFFFLPPPPPLPPSHASSLFSVLLCWVFWFDSLFFCYYIWFIFYFASLLPPPQPLPSFFVTQRVGIDQGDSPDLTQVSLHLISISQSTSQSTSI